MLEDTVLATLPPPVREGKMLFEVGVLVEGSLAITYISPVASEDMNNLPCWSKARPTGRKHLSRHALLSALAKMSMAAVVLLAGATGSPFLKGTMESL